MDDNVRILILLRLNAALCGGTASSPSIDTVKRRIRDGSILPFLEGWFGSGLRFDWVCAAEERQLIDEWAKFTEYVDERAAFDVRRNGVCLLMAYVLAGLRQGTSPPHRLPSSPAAPGG